MKKIFKMMMAVVAGFAALTACTNEPEEGVTPTPENEYVIVKVGMSKANKGSLTDTEGIKWAVGDQIKYAGGVELTSEALTAEDIEDDGYTANFKFPAALNEVNRTGWFSSTKNHPGNHNEVEFTLGNGSGNMYSQAKAGEMNNRYLFLHSGTGLINITKDEAPEVVMDIAGGIFRFMPYTETYNDEAIEYVELAGKNANSIVGTVAYDRGAGTYKGANDINWQNKNFVRVTLDELFALTNANSRESSKGVYMAIARTTETHPIEGYTITVKTDKATYTFSSDDNLVVGENELRNVYLKLENGSRVDDTASKGDLQYIGDLNGATAKLPSEGTTNKDGGYWYAQTRNTGADWVTREGAANVQFYTGITFECIDNATGEEADWLTVSYRNDGDTHWWITAQPNESSEERSATVTATFPDVDGYIVTEACKTKTVIITQSAAGSAKVISFTGGANNSVHNLQNMSYSNHSLGYMLANIDGTDNREWSKYYTQVEFKCISKEDYDNGIYDNEVDWLTCGYATNASGIFDCLWWIQVEANTSSETRSAVIISTWPEMEGFVYKDNIRQHVAFINQEGGYVEPDPDAPITEGYTYTIVKNNGNPSGATFGMPVGGANGADFRIENIKLNGNAVTLTQTMANEIIATAFKNVDGRPATGYDHFQFATDQIYMKVVSFNGSTMEAGVATTPDSQGYITRLTWYNSDGEEGGYWYVFVP